MVVNLNEGFKNNTKEKNIYNYYALEETTSFGIKRAAKTLTYLIRTDSCR